MQHELIDFWNREGVCLLRGTNLAYSIIQHNLVFKSLITNIENSKEISVNNFLFGVIFD
jgi:hypothetical protein